MGERLLKDEQGIAMGLAIVLIVVVGVMGAGLLVFVRNDLQAVIQVNQGQQAFEAADAGVQAARRELLSNACPQSYDGSVEEGDECDESEWSHWSESEAEDYEGKELDFDGKKIKVEIRHLPFPGEGNCAEGDTGDEGCAPVEPEENDEREFFKVESLGMSANSSARRKVEAIYYIDPRSVPKTYYALRDITIGGNATRIINTSIFAGRNILDLRVDTLQGEDKVYEDWERSPWNTTARDSLNSGAGAIGKITYSAGGGGNAASARAERYGEYDFDGESGSDPEFIRKDPPGDAQDEDEITYPFNPGTVDDDLIEFLCEVAREQSNYHSQSGTSFTVPDSGEDSYPDPSNQNTVYCVEFTGTSKGSVSFKSKDREGTLVVTNGDLKPSSSANSFKGVMIVDDPNPNDGEVLLYENDGDCDLKGYANVEGDMKIFGSATPFGSEEVANRPGFYSVELWSWRELYE